MKKSYLLIVTVIAGLISFGQSRPNNMDIGLFAGGTSGSNAKINGCVEVSLRIKPGHQAYTPIPVAEDFVVYLVAPKTDFTANDGLVITEVNQVIYRGTSSSLMLVQGVYDLGAADPDNLYFPVVLNSPIGMDLSSLSGITNSWSFAFTFKFNNPKPQSALNKIKIIDQLNNRGLSNFVGSSVFTNLQMSSQNQVTNSAFVKLPDNISPDIPATLAIGGLFPNPASTLVNVIIAAPKSDKLTLAVTDMSGKTVKQQVVNVEAGSNTIPVQISNFASGSYLVKLLCKTQDCETATAKFNKQ